MSNYTFDKFALAIVILLALTTSGRAQVAPTQDQLVTVLRDRIRSVSEAEVATLRTRLEPAIKAEQQAERTKRDLAGQACGLAARIEFLKWLVREYPRMRGNMDQNTGQRIKSWQRELDQRNWELTKANKELVSATAALNVARERRLAAERIVASKEGKNLQQVSELTYLYNMWRLNPPRVTWEAMMGRLTEVAREKHLTSNVTISTGVAPITLRYQPVGGQVFPAVNCRQCVVRLPVGHYNFWVETRGAAEPQKTAYFIFRELHTIPNPSGR